MGDPPHRQYTNDQQVKAELHSWLCVLLLVGTDVRAKLGAQYRKRQLEFVGMHPLRIGTAGGRTLPRPQMQQIGAALREVGAGDRHLKVAAIPMRARGTLQQRAGIIGSHFKSRVGLKRADPGPDVEYLRQAILGPEPISTQMSVLRCRRAARSEMNGQRVGSREHNDIAGRNAMLARGSLVDADLSDVAV